jgi:hypothetical protein
MSLAISTNCLSLSTLAPKPPKRLMICVVSSNYSKVSTITPILLHHCTNSVVVVCLLRLSKKKYISGLNSLLNACGLWSRTSWQFTLKHLGLMITLADNATLRSSDEWNRLIIPGCILSTIVSKYFG